MPQANSRRQTTAVSEGGALRARDGISLLTEGDVYLFSEGTHLRLYDKLGVHYLATDQVQGTYFAVWAPNAAKVSLMTEANDWSDSETALFPHGSSGIWEGFVEGMRRGAPYKYHVVSREDSYRVDKADPFAFQSELPPKTASVIWNSSYTWGDGEWMAGRGARNAPKSPMSVYELHLGS